MRLAQNAAHCTVKSAFLRSLDLVTRRQIVRVGLLRLDKHLDLGVEPLHSWSRTSFACGEVLVRHLSVRHTV